MKNVTDKMPKKYHNAILSWQEKWFDEYPYLLDHWQEYFPTRQDFCMCAYNDLETHDEIEVGDSAGKDKYISMADMNDDEGHQIMRMIRAQASTELGSIQQHRETLELAPDDESKFDILRVMAEELRHAYQMLHILVNDKRFTTKEKDDMVEEALQPVTGEHILDAFNIHYDTFVDNVAFTMLIDRVGKYQLTMQKVCAYKPMASSMPYMLQEEAFHLASGIKPFRRWAKLAGPGESPVTMKELQQHVNKWVPRALAMFGDERGGNKNVKFGLKDMNNITSSTMYMEEVEGCLDDINRCYLQGKYPELDVREATELAHRIRTQNQEYNGITAGDLLYMPDRKYFRRRGMYAFTLFGVDGTEFKDVEAYIDHLKDTLPERYPENGDFKFYVSELRKVHSGELTTEEAAKKMPTLEREGYCPCSKSVQYVVNFEEDESEATPGATTGVADN